MSRRVLVTDKVALSGLYPIVDDPSFEIVEIEDSSTAGFLDALANADALVVRSATQVNRDMIAKGTGLKAIGRAGVGVDNVDIAAATDAGIAVFNAPGGNTIAAAELTMALLIAVARKVSAAEASLRSGEWDRASFKGVELRGKVLGLIGAGRIGTEVASRCQAFGMTVVAYDPYLTEERAGEIGCELVTLETVLQVADFVSIHVPLTDETRGIVGADAFRTLKSSAFLVNASRGGVVDEAALADALHAGEIAGAALDVYEVEPLPIDSPLRSAPNMVLTPHLGASTGEAQVGVATEVAEKIRDYLNTGNTAAAINAASLG